MAGYQRYQLNERYTGTFTFMPADKNWIFDPTQNPYHNCPAHHQFEVNLVSWRLEISRRDDAGATAWPSSLFGGNEKVPPCF